METSRRSGLALYSLPVGDFGRTTPCRVGDSVDPGLCAGGKKNGRMGVAAIVSNGLWMAGEKIFLNSGFTKIAERDRFGLVIYPLRKGPKPQFRDVDKNTSTYKGLHIVYSNQCPMLSKSVNDVSEMATEHGLKVRVTVLINAREAQNAPSYYGTFSLLWNGRLLSDHYVSKGRFKNILKNEILNPRKER